MSNKIVKFFKDTQIKEVKKSELVDAEEILRIEEKIKNLQKQVEVFKQVLRYPN